jgi:transcriptional regulator with PAS, ATPase and Fis domain
MEDAGINAISKSLHFKNTRHCTGPEHSLEILRHYVAVGSPLFDVDGRIRACLGFFLPAHHGSPTLARLYMFTVLQSLDQRRRLTHFRKEVMQTNQLHLQMLNGSMPNPLFLSAEGRILFLGEGATKTFDLNPRKVGQLVDDLFTLKPPLPEILSNLRSNPQITIESEDLGKSWKAQIFPVYHHEHLAGIWLCTLGEKDSDDEGGSESPFYELLGNSSHLLRAKNLAEQLAPSDISVLLIGSSGTGKELFAKGIHQASSRKDGPFVSLNCGALPKDLAESELFGYAPGAFTGALKEGKEGLMESAAGGTLFLDEIGDMPLDLQVKLLRVLESQNLTRLGETQERPLNLRLVAATHRNLLHLVEHGKFREDLYFRLAASTILIPALNQMTEDIPTIFLHYLNLFCRRNGKPTPMVPEKLLSQLSKLQWRGNVRELRNAAEYSAAVSHPGQPLDIGHLPGLVRLSILFPDDGSDSSEETSSPPSSPVQSLPSKTHESDAEKWQRIHEETHGNAVSMMEKLGVSRATLYRKLQKYKLLQRDTRTHTQDP